MPCACTYHGLQSNPSRRSHFSGAGRSRRQPRASSEGLYLAALPALRGGGSALSCGPAQSPQSKLPLLWCTLVALLTLHCMPSACRRESAADQGCGAGAKAPGARQPQARRGKPGAAGGGGGSQRGGGRDLQAAAARRQQQEEELKEEVRQRPRPSLLLCSAVLLSPLLPRCLKLLGLTKERCAETCSHVTSAAT